MKPNTKRWRKARRRPYKPVPLNLTSEQWEALAKAVRVRLEYVGVCETNPATGQPCIEYRYSDGTVRREWAVGWCNGPVPGILL